MALVEINWTPTRRELRQFAVITIIGCAAVGLALRWWEHTSAGAIVWVVGALVGVVGCVVPPMVKPAYFLLSVVSWPIGVVVSYFVLGVFYYVLITGTGLVFRLVGRDPLRLKSEPDATTYWQPKALPGPENKERYLRQF